MTPHPSLFKGALARGGALSGRCIIRSALACPETSPADPQILRSLHASWISLIVMNALEVRNGKCLKQSSHPCKCRICFASNGGAGDTTITSPPTVSSQYEPPSISLVFCFICYERMSLKSLSHRQFQPNLLYCGRANCASGFLPSVVG